MNARISDARLEHCPHTLLNRHFGTALTGKSFPRCGASKAPKVALDVAGLTLRQPDVAQHPSSAFQTLSAGSRRAWSALFDWASALAHLGSCPANRWKTESATFAAIILTWLARVLHSVDRQLVEFSVMAGQANCINAATNIVMTPILPPEVEGSCDELTASGSFRPLSPAMVAIIIYDDFVSAATASAILKQSAENAQCDGRWNIIPWRADWLKFGPTAEEALKDATDAHLIVFAGRGAQSLPWWLQGWLERWAACRQEDAALAVFGLGKDTQDWPLEIFTLQNFAKWHGLTIIFDASQGLADGQAISTEPHLQHRPGMLLANDISRTMPAQRSAGTQ